MPNHVGHHLTVVSGSFPAIFDMDFEKFIPIPDEVKMPEGENGIPASIGIPVRYFFASEEEPHGINVSAMRNWDTNRWEQFKKDVYAALRILAQTKSVFTFDDAANSLLSTPPLSTIACKNTRIGMQSILKRDIDCMKRYSVKDWEWFFKMVWCHVNLGAADILDWRTKNWCTKWNAYYISVDETKNTVHFTTAWSTPYAIFDAIAKLLDKDTRIEVEYCSEDSSGHCGTFVLTRNHVDHKDLSETAVGKEANRAFTCKFYPDDEAE